MPHHAPPKQRIIVSRFSGGQKQIVFVVILCRVAPAGQIEAGPNNPTGPPPPGDAPPPAGEAGPAAQPAPGAAGEFFLTNDRVELRGGLAKGDERMLILNGNIQLKLDTREFLLLLVLAGNSLHRSFTSAGRAGAWRPFVPIEDLYSQLSKLSERVPPRRGGRAFWEDLSHSGIYRTVSDLRKRISAAGGNHKLIEMRTRGNGYRLSTPSRRLRLKLEDNLDRLPLTPPPVG